jgi:hypothetical protein
MPRSIAELLSFMSALFCLCMSLYAVTITRLKYLFLVLNELLLQLYSFAIIRMLSFENNYF